MSAAHYKLQHNLLELETEETINRLEVEHEMMRREVEVLQQTELARRDSNHSHYSSSDATIEQQDKEATERYISELKAYTEALKKDNDKLHRRLERAKEVITDREEDITQLTSDNKKLLDRIRQNREHIHLLTGQGGIYASPQSQSMSSRTMPSTPNYRERATPRQTPGSARYVAPSQHAQSSHAMQMQNQQHLQHHTPMHGVHSQQDDRHDSFATLLLADQVLNGQNSAPTTPRRAIGHGHPTSSAARHHRAAQSLSSLAIPQTAPMQMQAQYSPSAGQTGYGAPMTTASLLSPAQLGGPSPSQAQGYEHPSPYPRISPRERVRRRKSRDSTISASDEEERAKELLRVSPQQAPTLQSTAPYVGYAPVQRTMVQNIPREAQVQDARANQSRPTPSPRYEPVRVRQAMQVDVDDDETEEEHPEEVESDIDIPASQASLSASAMLRRDPRESFEIAGSPHTQQRAYQPASQPPMQTAEYRAGSSNVRAHLPISQAGSVTEKGRVLQAKIFGSVTKPGMATEGGEKRKRLPSEDEIRAKRLRAKASEGLGLGLEL